MEYPFGSWAFVFDFGLCVQFCNLMDSSFEKPLKRKYDQINKILLKKAKRKKNEKKKERKEGRKEKEKRIQISVIRESDGLLGETSEFDRRDRRKVVAEDNRRLSVAVRRV